MPYDYRVSTHVANATGSLMIIPLTTIGIQRFRPLGRSECGDPKMVAIVSYPPRGTHHLDIMSLKGMELPVVVDEVPRTSCEEY